MTYALLMVGEILGQYRDHGPIRARAWEAAEALRRLLGYGYESAALEARLAA